MYKFFPTRMLGSVHARQPTVILQVSFWMRKNEEREKGEECKSVATVILCGPDVFFFKKK